MFFCAFSLLCHIPSAAPGPSWKPPVAILLSECFEYKDRASDLTYPSVNQLKIIGLHQVLNEENILILLKKNF